MNLKLDTFIRTAKKSQRLQKHASIIYSHGRPIAFGFNNAVWHSEESAINWIGNLACKGKILVNLRLTVGEKIGLSYPCEKCMEKIRRVGFKKVLYSTNDGIFEEIKL